MMIPSTRVSTWARDTGTVELSDLISTFKANYLSLWESLPVDSPPLDFLYASRRQRENEQKLDHFLEGASLNASELDEDERRKYAERVRIAVRSTVVELFSRTRRGQAEAVLDEFSRTGDKFVCQARSFDPAIVWEDIHQALRNLWIMNSMQIAFGKRVSLTPSGFAYSMLYPYTDNYLDDTGISMNRKKAFIEDLGRRLCGEKIETESHRERILCDLVRHIETEYCREEYPLVYQSLCAIHSAQARSLALQGEDNVRMTDLLDITMEKGGTSVLADAYLAAGRLSEAEAEFSFGYGVFLQIIDDVQDIDEDTVNKHHTLIAPETSKGPLDGLINKLLWLQRDVMRSLPRPESGQAHALSELIEGGCMMLVLEAIARHCRLYSQSFLEEMEAHSPYSLAYLATLKQKMKRKLEKARMAGKMTGRSWPWPVLSDGYVSPDGSGERTLNQRNARLI